MRLIIIIVFSTFYCNAQIESKTYEFKYYKNGRYKKTKKTELYLVNKSDTIKCNISKNKIAIPKDVSKCSVVFYDKNKIYKIEGVDFSGLEDDMKVLFAFDNNPENFGPTNLSNGYFHMPTNSVIIVDDLYKAKKIYFINFNSFATDYNIPLKSYSRSVIIE